MDDENKGQQKRRIDAMDQESSSVDVIDHKRKFGAFSGLSSSLSSSRSLSTNSIATDPSLTDWLGIFDNMPEHLQTQALASLVPMCRQTQIRHLQAVIAPYFQVDFIYNLPKELALRVFDCLTLRDLVVAATISRFWRSLAEDRVLWAQKCRQYSIQELLPPILCRKENWSLHTTGSIDEDDCSSCSTSTTMACLTFSKANLYASPAKSPLPVSVHYPHSPTTTTTIPSCLERSRWKAIYLRNQRISNNWRLRRANGICRLRGHDEHVITCLKLRGHVIITGSDDCTLCVWSTATAKCTQKLSGHVGGVWALQLSKDGKIAISGSTDRTVRVWNTETGEMLHCLNGHTSTVRCMSLRGKLLVTGSRDCSLKLWDIEQGRCIRSLYGHLAAVRCVKFDGQLIVSGAYDHNIHVWNAHTGALEHVLQGHTNRVYSLYFASKRDLIISGSLDTTIRVWNVKTGECLQTLVGHQSLTSGMKLRGNILVSANADSTIKVWDIVDGTCTHTLAGTHKHSSAVTGLRFLQNGLVATSGDDGTVKLWDINEGTFVCDLLRLQSSGTGGCVWRIKATQTLLVCAVGSRNGTEDTRLILMDFDAPYP